MDNIEKLLQDLNDLKQKKFEIEKLRLEIDQMELYYQAMHLEAMRRAAVQTFYNPFWPL